MKSSLRSNSFRVFRPARFGVVIGLLFLASCSSPPTLESVGGVVLEFAVDETAATQPPSKEVLARSVEVIRRRLDPSGAKGVSVRVTDQGRLEVSLPGVNADQRRQALSLITRLGTVEFAIMANPHDHRSLINEAQAGPMDKDELESDGEVVAAWHQTSLQSDGQPEDLNASQVASRDKPLDGNTVVRQFLVLREIDDARVTGRFLHRVAIGLDDRGQACINFTLDKEGARRFFHLTSRNSPAPDGYKRQMAILFDGRIHSAPNINSSISDQCQITGNFSREELQNLVDVLNAGVLESPLNPTPISEQVISPKKGNAASGKN